MSTRSPERVGAAGPIVAWTAVGLFLRFLRLDSQSFWVDEAFSIKYAALWGSLGWDGLLDNLHGPLHALVLHLWCSVAGTSEFAIRAPHAIVGAATVPLLYWAARPAISRASALWACALLALSPFHLWYSQEVRNYVFLMFWAVLGTGLYLRLPQRTSWRRGVGYGLVHAAGLWSNLSHAFALVAHGVARCVARPGPPWRLLVFAWVGALALLAPWLWRFWEHRVEPSGALALRPVAAAERLRGETTSPFLGIPYTYYVFSVGYSLGPSVRELRVEPRLGGEGAQLPLVALAMAGFGLAAALGAWRLWRERAGRAWLVLAVAPVLLTFAVSSRNLKVFNPRYAAVAFPAYVVAVAHGLTSPARRSARLALCASLFVPTGVSLAQYESSPRYAKEDARSLAAHLRARATARDLVFFVGTDEPLQQYYWRGLRTGAGGVRKSDQNEWRERPFAERTERFVALADSVEQVYIAFLRPESVDPTDEWRRWLRAQRPPREVTQFVGCEVWRIEGGRLARSDAGGAR